VGFIPQASYDHGIVKNPRHVYLLSGLLLSLACACSSTRNANSEISGDLYRIGVGMLSDGQFPQAISVLEQAREQDSENATIRSQLGLAYMKVENWEHAETHLREATRLDPEFAEAWNNLSAFYVMRKRPDEAIDAANKALKIPTYSTPEMARANLARARLLKEDYKGARSEAEKALRISPNHCGLRVLLSKTLVDDKDFEAALVEAQKARRTCPSWETAHLWEAYSYYKIGQRRQAQSKYAEIISLFKRGEAAEQSRVALKDLSQRIPLKEPKI